jgi:aminoglycoside phosphotransferase (APT) family kinase protein
MKNKSTQSIKKFAEVVKGIIKQFYGSAPKKVVPLTGGLTNYVYGVQVENEDIVVRISEKSSSLEGFQKEQWAVAKAAQIKIPVPEILEVGQYESSVVFMIVRKTEGKDPLKLDDKLKVVEEMGTYLAQVHTIPTTGFWAHFRLDRKHTFKIS